MSTPPVPQTFRVTPAGTLCSANGAVIPLLSVDLGIEVKDTLASLELRQVYRNIERQPIEAVYGFPIPESAAPHRVEVRIGDRLIRTIIDAKEAGLAAFDDAMASGLAAVLVGADRPNILSLSLGNLRPGEQAVVTIGLAMELETVGDVARLLVPTTIAPRFVSEQEAATIDPAELDALLPPTLAEVPVGLRMRATFEGASPITEVACVSHPARTEFRDGRAVVTFSQDDVPLDQDIVLTVRYAESTGSSVLTARDGDDACAVALTFHEPEISETRQPCEVIFLIDRSGSMQGESIGQARRTLQLCLRSLCEGDRFNILGFGSNLVSLFPTPVAYNQRSLDAASRHVEQLDADLGGTEMLAAIKAALRPECGASRRIVLITDGQVTDEAAIAAEAARHSTTRFYVFAIGRGVNENLARRLARQGGGAAEFVHPNERIEDKVMRQFSRITGPTIGPVSLDWEGAEPDLLSPGTLRAPEHGMPMRLYARLPLGRNARATLRAQVNGTPREWSMLVDTTDPSERSPLPAIMARAVLRDWEEADETPDEAAISRFVALSRRYGVVCRATTFVGVEESTAPAREGTEPPVLRRVPVALTANWGGTVSLCGGGPPVAQVGLHLPRYVARDGCWSDLASGPPFDSPGEVPKITAKRGRGLIARMTLPESRWSRRRAPREAITPLDPLAALIALQRADGSWAMDAALLALVGIDRATVDRLRERFGLLKNTAGSILATALALRALTGHQHAEPLWRSIARKAHVWLSRNGGDPSGSGDWIARINAELGP